MAGVSDWSVVLRSSLSDVRPWPINRERLLRRFTNDSVLGSELAAGMTPRSGALRYTLTSSGLLRRLSALSRIDTNATPRKAPPNKPSSALIEKFGLLGFKAGLAGSITLMLLTLIAEATPASFIFWSIDS